jgi:predicted lipoprotein with Yx(FWY)xxD motif
MRKLLGATAAGAIAAVAIAGCGGASPAGSSSSGPAAVQARTLPDLGTVLVDGQGYTLYMFPPDHRDRVTCTGPCAGSWPPLAEPTGATPKTGGKVDRSLVGTAPNPNPDGGEVVTYHGWPLYTYAGDTQPGQATGQALDLNGGYWYVMRPSGKVVKAAGGGHG